MAFLCSHDYGRTLWQRLRCLAPLLIACVIVLEARAVSIETVIDQATGEVFFKNANPTAETLDGYALFSPSGNSLVTANLDSISANYDLSGDQTVDSTAEWFFLSQTSASISEVSSVSLSGSLDPGEVVSLGQIWNVGDLEALFVTLSAGVTTTDSIGMFRDLSADYDNDLDVDLDDLVIYNATFGSTTLLDADGNNDGVVDAADYAIWRESPLLSLDVATSASVTPSLLVISVPEPSGGLLLTAISLVAAGVRRRLRQR